MRLPSCDRCGYISPISPDIPGTEWETDLDQAIALAPVGETELPALVDRARQVLENARSAAEVLEARDRASVAYDAAKKATRLAKAKGAHDELIAAGHRVQADALEIEARAKRRLADEYDAAQERGEVAKIGDNLPSVPKQNSKPTAADIGLSRKDIHEARIIRDAEVADPGIVRRTVDAAVAAGDEPSKAKVRRAVLEVARPAQPQQPQTRKQAICAKVVDAVSILAGLPPAHEVASYFAGDDSAIIISERLRQAAEWLADFSDAWKDEQC